MKLNKFLDLMLNAQTDSDLNYYCLKILQNQLNLVDLNFTTII